jgi:hypothetical protein
MSDATPTPIIVNASPTPAQIAAGIRQAVLVIGTIAGMLGYGQFAGKLSPILTILGPLSVVISYAWGQWVTRRSEQDKAVLANAAPNSIGVVR